MDIRNADAAELDGLARLWYDGWQDAHAAIVPPGLARLRTFESFRARLAAALSSVRVLGRPGAALGFYILKDDELYQIYVAAQSRGTGAATTLIRHAEAQLAADGVATAWLACTVGNDRAARFYEKSGWRRVLTEPYSAETSEGTFTLDVWRYEKRLIRQTLRRLRSPTDM